VSILFSPSLKPIYWARQHAGLTAKTSLDALLKNAVFQFHAGRGEIRIGSRFFALPRRARTRIALGAGLVVGGVLGFLPVLGFWMIPLGLLVLSRDLPTARRWRRSLVVRMERRRTKRPRPKERAEKQAAESD
tara:strand:- start:18508 stop:18906 length:399 start_codon:yes stop_codon:yes gene_type:complete